MLSKLIIKKVSKRKLKIFGLVVLLLVLPLILFTVYQIQDTRSRAALPEKLETEQGVLSSNGVSKQSDSGASGGSYVLFNKSGVPTPTTPPSTGRCATGQTFDVSSYGATPNDNQSDQNAIVSAINAAKASGGGRVMFSEGTYLSGMMQVSGANNVALCGQGMDMTHIEQTSGYNLLQLRNSSGFSINNLTLDGKSLPTTQYLIDIQDSPEFVFDSSAIRNVNNATLNNVHGLLIAPGSPNALVIRSVFENIIGYAVVRGVSTNNYRDSSDAIAGLRVLDSQFSNITSRPSNIGEDSDAVVFATRGYMTNGLVENNTFHNIGKRAVKSQANGTIVRCNTITRSLSGTSFAAISAYGNNHLFENNTITNTGQSRYYRTISVNGSSVVVSNNEISGDITSTDGVALVGGDDSDVGIYGEKKNILIKDNTFLDVQYAVETAYQQYPVHKNVSVTGNITCATQGWWKNSMDTSTTSINNNTARCGVAPITRNGTFTSFSILQEPDPTCSR